jgi:hypothetical protein
LIAELRNVTYEEWADDHRKAVAYRTTRNGSRDVAISSDDFEAWLKQTRQVAHMELLWVFAEEKVAHQLSQKASR